MKDYLEYNTTGDLAIDVKGYFIKFGCSNTYEHTMEVVNELFNLQEYCGSIEQGSLTACYCHDLGRVVRNDEILEFCLINNINVTEEERLLPSILHQKISCLITEKVFKIKDKTILNAIKYHTTLRRNPSMTEMQVFLADKMSWKEDDYKEIVKRIKDISIESIEKAIYYYLWDLNNKKRTLKLYHSDSQDAFDYFDQKYYGMY